MGVSCGGVRDRQVDDFPHSESKGIIAQLLATGEALPSSF